MNLKSAARRLGVHYQTAYRWVRSGQLLAVKVGSGYEISEWALERFEAQRAATERLPEGAQSHTIPLTAGSHSASSAASLHALARMVDAVTVDADAVVNRAALIAAEALGDTAVVYRRSDAGAIEVSRVAHRDATLEVAAATLARDPRTVNSFVLTTFRGGTSVFVPQVPQRELRRCLDPELHEHLNALGCYSLISVPIGADGALLATRDLPGRPYTHDDVAFLEAIASRVQLGLVRAERGARSRNTRRTVLSALTVAVHLDDLPVTAVSLHDQLDAAVGDDPEACVGVLDLDLRHRACTKAYSVLLGEDTNVIECTPLALYVRARAALDEITDPVLRGELDFCGGDLALTGGRGRVSLHVAMLRRRDATPWGLVVVAHPVAELTTAHAGA